MTIDLQKFCSADVCRHYLCKPFVFDGFTYATDGYIIVRVSASPEYSEQPLAPGARAAGYFTDPADVFSPLPTIVFPPLDEDDQCAACEGRGTEHDCPDCECTCEECDGAGQPMIYSEVSVGIGNAVYSGRYIYMIMSLPHIEIAEPHPEKPLRFRFEGGEGLLQPRKRNALCEKHIVVGEIVAGAAA